MSTIKVLDELETIELQKFIENKILKQAVKKVLLTPVYYNGIIEAGKEPNTTQNFATQSALFAIQANPEVTNEQLGEGLRASVSALRLIDLGFLEIEKYKPVSKEPVKVNKAR